MSRQVLQNKLRLKTRIIFISWSALFAIAVAQSSTTTTTTFESTTPTTERISSSIPTNCTPPSIDDFPPDLFTQSERLSGWVAVHFFASAYIFFSIALVCDEYFVPSIEAICEGMGLPSDVAGATFMAVGTSAPELFTNIIGTFITQGDVGVGTIVGSAVFNILGIAGLCGLAVKTALPLEWYPLTRDCLFYSISVLLLILTLENRRVYWYEAVALVGTYLIYILVMYKNSFLRKGAESLLSSCRAKGKGENSRVRRSSFISELGETAPLLGDNEGSYERMKKSLGEGEEDLTAEEMDKLLLAKAMEEKGEKDEWGLCSFPKGGGPFTYLMWGASWPARAALRVTIPDCREPTWRPYYLLTFIICIAWIASLSYIVTWMMTIIGHTFGIPDSVMGLTFIAAGTSVPEAVSSVIVARQGLGTMSISNSIGSNTFDILICLGLPWLIRSSLISTSAAAPFIQINSGGMGYSAGLLMASLLLLYLTLAFNSFYLDKKVGCIALGLYAVYLVLASLLELNVFTTLNLPTCEIST